MKLKTKLLPVIVLLIAISFLGLFFLTRHTESEKKEPFFELYEGLPLETVSFEGTIRAASMIPDPAKNDYDSCLYALFVELNSVLSKTALSSEIV